MEIDIERDTINPEFVLIDMRWTDSSTRGSMNISISDARELAEQILGFVEGL